MDSRFSLKGAAMAGAALAVGSFVADAFVAPSASAGRPAALRATAAAAAAAASPVQQQQGPSALAFAAPAGALIACSALAAKRAPEASRRGAPVAMSAYDASKEIGVTAPMGYFDPCNFMKDGDEALFKNYREKELKHGRIAMLALTGFLVQPFAESGHIGFSGVPGGVQALTTYPGSAGFGVLFLVAGFFELRILPDMEKEPGNFDDPLNVVSGGNIGAYDENWRNFEINNGRLAMIGAIGTITAGFYTGYDAYEQWGHAKGAAIDYLKTTLQNAAP